ncbi:GGDEF domain-containing protein [uncultured Methanobrevibacter sp.]|uniref:GGDEF domain-containing protein n=1 Tax=uncultured Methanobrevibacter sp. TaxID=253161 RepID=UPI0025D33E44|nr:GGDEF domain-containing protein [uncultured Methanobrevibacter sp.]
MAGLYKILLISDDEKDTVYKKFQDIIEEIDEIDLIYSTSQTNDLKNKMERDFYQIFIDLDDLKIDINELVHIIRMYLSSLPLTIVIAKDTSKLNHTLIPKVVFMSRLYMYESPDLFHHQLKNTIEILRYNRNINDLTHLPGNFVVNDVLTQKIENNEDFAIMYLDIDKFKSFTDYYGLNRANQVLFYLSQLINSLVEEYGEMKDLISHIGGDDFAVIFHNYESAKIVGEKLIEKFDSAVPEYYDDEDLERGYISVLNRQGEYNDYPLVSLSVTTISNEFNEYKNTEEIYKKMSEIKHEAKEFSGSVLLQS